MRNCGCNEEEAGRRLLYLAATVPEEENTPTSLNYIIPLNFLQTLINRSIN